MTDTPEIYRKYILPKIKKMPEYDRWGKEKVLFNNKKFYLIKDKKWKDTSKNNLHLLSILHQKNIRSIRDLRKSHLPLLKNIRNNGLKFIKKTYQIPEEEILIYFHYYPSIWHLHVHFVNIEKEDNKIDEIITGRAFLLENIINNLNYDGNYYKNVNITLVVSGKQIKKLNGF